jgi:hypothetical protein
MHTSYPPTDCTLNRSELLEHRKQFRQHFRVFERFLDDFCRDNNLFSDLAPGRIFKPDTVSVMPKTALIDFAMRQWLNFADPVVRPSVIGHSHCPGKDQYLLSPDNEVTSDTLLAMRVARG